MINFGNMGKEEKAIKSQEKFNKEYESIMKGSDSAVVVNVEWTTKGDSFKKLSMYDNHTPVKTSGSTTLLNQL